MLGLWQSRLSEAQHATDIFLLNKETQDKTIKLMGEIPTPPFEFVPGMTILLELCRAYPK